MDNLKLVAVDIDGTFVDHNNHYDLAEFRRLFKVMQERNIEFVVASGNQYPHLARLFPDDLRDQLNFVAENGALTLAHGREVFCGGLSWSTLTRAVAAVKAIPGANYIVSTPEAGYFPANSAEFFKEESEHYCASLAEFDDLTEIKDKQILKLTARVEPAEVPLIEAAFKDWPDLHVTSSGFGYLDMINPKLHKAFGLQILGEHFRIAPEQMVVFGDSANDQEMFKLAGRAYAMANAEQILLDLTDYRAPSNEENGVLRVLGQLLA
ncbi:Cof-type HAD-IIB family hydrolase [Lapidilactobacillus salsurivasis]